MNREFDIVLYGASGFTGKFTAEYLAGTGTNARIALAGRSTERLLAVRDSLGGAAQSWPIVIADSESQPTLDAMAARAQVVVSTVGPYSRYGLPLVAACAAAGTDYADLTGEALFVRNSIDRHHKQAVDTGARIVHACGIDSIPSDLSVYSLFRAVGEDGTGQLGDTCLVVRGVSCTISGGSIASLIEVFDCASSDPDARRQLYDPYTLSPDRGAEPDVGPERDLRIRRGREIAPELSNIWTGGFPMAPYNTRIVRRSNALQNWCYGRSFRYSEAMSTGPSFYASAAAALLTGATIGVLGAGTRYFRPYIRGLVERVVPKPGDGPSEKARERGYYSIETYTATTTGARYVARMAQQGDPGYTATPVLLGETALALAAERARLPDMRGVLTPVAAMGDVLLDRLAAVGVRIEIARLS